VAKKKTNRKKYVPYHAAQEASRKANVSSRREYLNWVDIKEPKGIPRQPNYTYRDVWQGWSLFLGTSNVFVSNKAQQRRVSYEEALRYARSSGIKTREEWEAREHPLGIPRNPEVAYRYRDGEKLFCGWQYFLGIRKFAVAATVETHRSEKILLIAGVDDIRVPKNEVTISTHPSKSHAFQYLQRQQLKTIRAFWAPASFDWRTSAQRYGAHEGAEVWRFRNLCEWVSDLSFDLSAV
jgi:hypothetical protein